MLRLYNKDINTNTVFDTRKGRHVAWQLVIELYINSKCYMYWNMNEKQFRLNFITVLYKPDPTLLFLQR